MPRADAPIGVFDSGIGGISVLRALRAALPHDDFVYFADSAHAPYGERDDAHVQARSRAVLAELQAAHGIKAFVIACNTATAAAAEALRAAHPDQVIVGIEPALKPALTLTRTGRIGVLATRGTLASPKFRALHHGLATRAEFVMQPCDGLANAIEKEAACADGTSARALIDQYLSALGPLGADPGAIDTLVLGCTHYIFVADELRALVGPEVRFIETGEPVARQTRRLLETAGLLGGPDSVPGSIRLLTTGPVAMLQAAAQRWLDLPADCCAGVGVPSSFIAQSASSA